MDSERIILRGRTLEGSLLNSLAGAESIIESSLNMNNFGKK
jgi:hypothetical protein